MTSSLSSTLRGALALVGKPTNATNNSMAAVPTALTRQALDRLASSTPEQLQAEEVNLREMCQHLFNWNGDNRSNKNLIRAFNTALNTEGKYAHTVELTAFLAAAAPLLEGDRIARIYSVINEVDCVYAPAKYTLQLSRIIKTVFESFSPERAERLMRSLWVESHTGDWWNITLGPQPELTPEQLEAVAQHAAEEVLPTAETLTEQIATGTAHWNTLDGFKELLANIPQNEAITNYYTDYRARLSAGEAMPTEPALLSAYIPWLPINTRPESPISGLLNILTNITTIEGYRAPRKPRQFSELFPPMERQNHQTFPIARIFRDLGRLNLPQGAGVALINDPVTLAANGKHMGNCTNSYRRNMEEGKYTLFLITYNGGEYNAAVTPSHNKTTWKLQEINSRFNRGNVPAELRTAMENYANGISVEETQDVIKSIALTASATAGNMSLY